MRNMEMTPANIDLKSEPQDVNGIPGDNDRERDAYWSKQLEIELAKDSDEELAQVRNKEKVANSGAFLRQIVSFRQMSDRRMEALSGEKI
jgi:hypothetical protein